MSGPWDAPFFQVLLLVQFLFVLTPVCAIGRELCHDFFVICGICLVALATLCAWCYSTLCTLGSLLLPTREGVEGDMDANFVIKSLYDAGNPHLWTLADELHWQWLWMKGLGWIVKYEVCWLMDFLCWHFWAIGPAIGIFIWLESQWFARLLFTPFEAMLRYLKYKWSTNVPRLYVKDVRIWVHLDTEIHSLWILPRRF